jgi:hypothetical protein
MTAYRGSAGASDMDGRAVAGAGPWPWPLVLAAAAGAVAIGATMDLDMVWLVGLVVLALAAMVGPQRERLFSESTGGRRAAAALAVIVVAVAADVLVQALVRNEDWAAPNTWGGVAAALVILAAGALSHARAGRRTRPLG